MSLPSDAAIGRLEGWDSLGHMRIILEIERQLRRQLSTDEIVAIEDIGAVQLLLETTSSPM